jgi:opacity protein-like surface antigen
MTTRARLAFTVSFLALGAAASSATAAEADGLQFYAGLGIEYGDAESTFGDQSELWAGSVFGGARYTFPGNFFIGAEGETSLFSSWEPPFTGEVDRIWRLRGRLGYDFGSVAVFGAVGGVWVDGLIAGAPFSDSADGLTYGGGIDYAVSERFDLRLEVIRDETTLSDGSYEWDNTSVRAGAVIKF